MAQITNANIKRIIREVAQGASEFSRRNKKILGGAGAAGAAGYAGADGILDLSRKAIGIGKRMANICGEDQELHNDQTLPPESH